MYVIVINDNQSVQCIQKPHVKDGEHQHRVQRFYPPPGRVGIMSSRGCGLNDTLVTSRLVIGGNDYHDFIHGMRILYCDVRSCTKTVLNYECRLFILSIFLCSWSSNHSVNHSLLLCSA